MPDLSALSLQTALTPVALSTVAAPLENAGNTAEPGTGAGTSAGSTTGTPSFDALLALQVTTQAATPETAAAILPESGKTLQDAAIAVAALPLASLPQAALLKVNVARPAPGADATADATVATADPLAELTTEGVASSDGAAEVAPQPDIALFAAIFAAPERLATPASVPGPQAEPTDTVPAPKAIAVPAAPATAIAPATPAAVAVAIASTAQIELAPSARTSAVPAAAQVAAPASGTPVETQASAIVMPAAATANNPVATAQAMPTAPAAAPAPAVPDAEPAAGDAPIAPASSDAAPRKQATSAPEAAGPQLAESPAPSAIPAAILAEAPVQTDAQPTVGTAARSEARAERIDFATLVDTLARAREEASPRTVNVAVTNTDFGRVSLRFDSNDNGLAVAMSSADPGFARAVSASADAAATSADTRNPNQQAPNSQAQGDARAQASDANSQRQQQQGQSQQARADARFAANTQTSTRRDNDADTTGDSGIYA